MTQNLTRLPIGDTTNGSLLIRAELRHPDGSLSSEPFTFGINYTPEGERGTIISLFPEYIEGKLEELAGDGVEVLEWEIRARRDAHRPETEFDHDAAELADYNRDLY